MAFCGLHTKPHCVRGFSNHYHMPFDPKISHETCTIREKNCNCVGYTSMLDKKLVHGLKLQQQLRYQHFTECTYCTVLGSFNHYNITTFSHKATTGEDFEEIHQVVLDGISNNMASLFQSSNYVAINTTYSITMGYYVINFSQRSKLCRKAQHVMDFIYSWRTSYQGAVFKMYGIKDKVALVAKTAATSHHCSKTDYFTPMSWCYGSKSC